jgi:hypothetical protein
VDILASRFFRELQLKRRLAGELTRLNYAGQFKPFIYLNLSGGRIEVPFGRWISRAKTRGFAGFITLGRPCCDGSAGTERRN